MVLLVAVYKMDGEQSSHRAAEKEKIKEMLRDAIRILCQNTVTYHTKLSVEALIGITIDDGEHHIILSINESTSAAQHEAYQTEEQHVNTETDYPSYHLQEMTVNNSQFNDSINYNQQHKPCLPYKAVVKKETSVISYNVGQYDTFPHNSITNSYTENPYSAAGGSYSGYEDADYDHQMAFDIGDGQKTIASGVASGPRRGIGRGRGPRMKCRPRQNVASARSSPTVKREPGRDVDTTMGGKRQSLDAGEVSHVTVYTCQRCGKQMNRLTSFQRHKKSHLGIIYRCDGCGKILSRKDHLTEHRRKCPAAVLQVPLD